jgi:hypothetical protein
MRQPIVLLALSAFSAVAFAADPQLMNMVMPDAKILAGVNAASARTSPFGQFVITKIGMLGQEPQKFIAATGFDPLQDVSEVLAASAADPAKPGGILLVRGNFNVDKLVTAVTGHTNVQVGTYGGARLLEVSGPKDQLAHAVAFLGTSIAVAGDVASVKAAIDRNSVLNSIDAALATKVNDLSIAEDEWLVSSASIGSLLPANAGSGASGPAAQILPLLKNIQSFSGGVKFGENVQVTGQAVTNDPQNAAALNAVIRLVVSLAAVNTGTNPQLSQVAQWLQTLQVTTAGPAVNVALSIPETQIEALLNSVPVRAVKTDRVARVRGRSFHNGN